MGWSWFFSEYKGTVAKVLLSSLAWEWTFPFLLKQLLSCWPPAAYFYGTIIFSYCFLFLIIWNFNCLCISFIIFQIIYYYLARNLNTFTASMFESKIISSWWFQGVNIVFRLSIPKHTKRFRRGNVLYCWGGKAWSERNMAYIPYCPWLLNTKSLLIQSEISINLIYL